MRSKQKALQSDVLARFVTLHVTHSKMHQSYRWWFQAIVVIRGRTKQNNDEIR